MTTDRDAADADGINASIRGAAVDARRVTTVCPPEDAPAVRCASDSLEPPVTCESAHRYSSAASDRSVLANDGGRSRRVDEPVESNGVSTAFRVAANRGLARARRRALRVQARACCRGPDREAAGEIVDILTRAQGEGRGAFGTLRPHWSLRSRRASQSTRPLEALRSPQTLRPGFTTWTLQPLCAGSALRALQTLSAGVAFWSLEDRAHPYRPSDLEDPVPRYHLLGLEDRCAPVSPFGP